MKGKSVSKDFLILSILTVVTVAVWIAIDIYQVLNKSEIPKILEKQAEPLNPKMEVSVLDELEKQTFYDWSEDRGQSAPPGTESATIEIPSF